MTLILASNSATRRAMLDQAGVDYVCLPGDFDEGPAKQRLPGGGQALVLELAQGKALAAEAASADWVIGSDSSVVVGGVRYSKPNSREEAAAHLAAFSGREMQLSSGVALVRDGRCDWTHAETAHLYVRSLSAEFIESYLDAEWPAVSYCVGVFRIEGRGVTLFDRVDGSQFTVLGMPLLPLLGALRDRGVIPA